MRARLIMTLLIRDEEDIIEDNISFHLNNGVDFIVAVDNGSKDKTPYILEKYQKKGQLFFSILKEHTYEQSKWVSQMAKRAVDEFGATHLFHCDGDEFWLPTRGNLKAFLPNKNEIFYVPVINYIPPQEIHDGRFSFNHFEYLVASPLRYPKELENQISSKIFLYEYPKKVMTTNQFSQITAGNHDVITDKPIVKKMVNNIFIHHFPVRSYKQFKKRVIKGGRAMEMSPIKDPNTNWHIRAWYKLYRKGKLKEEYDKLSLRERVDQFLEKDVIRRTKVPKKIRWAKWIFKVKRIIWKVTKFTERYPLKRDHQPNDYHPHPNT